MIEFAEAEPGKAAETIVFSSKFCCPVSGFSISEIEPRLFSFNNPFGACPKCGGIGFEQKVDPDLIVPNPDQTLKKGRRCALGQIALPLLRADARSIGRGL